MRGLIEKTPLALASLLLGTAALGNLLGGFWPPIRLILQLPVLLGFIWLVGRLWVTRSSLKEEFRSPIVASCFAALLMTYQLLVGALPLPHLLGTILWLLGFAAYLSYILYFTYAFAWKKDLKLVYPSWFIVYVGIAIVGVTAPVYNQHLLGWISLIIAGIGFLVFIPFVVTRLMKHQVEVNFLPILAILAAPTSLLLTAYLSLSTSPNLWIAGSLALLAQVIYLGVVFHFPKLHGRSGFSPLFAAFTFPLVSTAIGFRLFLAKLAITNPLLWVLSYAEVVIASLIVAYVFYGYAKFFIGLKQTNPLKNIV